MTRYAVDAPTVLRIVTDGVVVAADHQLVAPHAVRTHAMTILLRQVQCGDLTEREARSLHVAVTELKIRVLGDRVSRWTSFLLASEHGWDSTYDAEHLAVALLQADALVTVDEGLARRAEGVVELAPFSALSR